MFVMCLFKVRVGDKVVESPVMGFGDIAVLERLFPKNAIWECRKSTLDNVMFPTTQQMEALYTALVQYFAENVLSVELFQTGNATGSFPVVSTVRSLFQHLIGFCERQLGFKRPEVFQVAVAQKEAQYRREADAAKEKYRQESLAQLQTLPRINRPGDATLTARLKLKLAEYKRRIDETCQHPDLGMRVNPEYRDSAYKIEVLEALLALSPAKQLDLKRLAENAMERLSDGRFFADGYYWACGVIAHYVGQPIKGVEIEAELPQLVSV